MRPDYRGEMEAAHQNAPLSESNRQMTRGGAALSLTTS
ncbi:hypothetical protein VIC_005004 [Vibrio coralliilyticus ATCC BAA-450]|nr:hypothetical protein VIC_005004 [Vibrio coralliilyticus ATCC BAA-450]